MNIFQSIVLSLVEGITEFLPISSTGHLILAAYFLRINQTEFVKSFEIFIQLGAIFAVLNLYAKKVIKNRKVIIRIMAAFVPTALIGLVLYKIIKQYLLGNIMVTVSALFLGGVVLIILERYYREKEDSIERVENVSIRHALIIGLFQSVSVIPGVSRAAATIIAGMYLGLNRSTAVEFSFLLAVPTLLAASGLDMLKSSLFFSSYDYILLIVGFIGAYFSALLTIKTLLRFVKRNNFIPFGVYRILLALLFLLVIKR